MVRSSMSLLRPTAAGTAPSQTGLSMNQSAAGETRASACGLG
jgi:hypothetical protein